MKNIIFDLLFDIDAESEKPKHDQLHKKMFEGALIEEVEFEEIVDDSNNKPPQEDIVQDAIILD